MLKTHYYMKEIQELADGSNFAAISIGKLDELGDYELDLSNEIRLKGSVALGQALGTTGAEMTLHRFKPGEGLPFVHTHNNHEEIYVVISGRGEITVDGVTVPVFEGSAVKIEPNGKRSIRNTSDTPMVVLCTAYRSYSFMSDDDDDVNILAEKR